MQLKHHSLSLPNLCEQWDDNTDSGRLLWLDIGSPPQPLIISIFVKDDRSFI